jgi:hypothetical protein
MITSHLKTGVKPSVETLRVPNMLKALNISVSIKMSSHLKTGVKLSPETTCVLNMPQTLDSVRLNTDIMQITVSHSSHLTRKL